MFFFTGCQIHLCESPSSSSFVCQWSHQQENTNNSKHFVCHSIRSIFSLFSLSHSSPELVLILLAYFNQIFLSKISNKLGLGKFYVFLKSLSEYREKMHISNSTGKSCWWNTATYIPANQVVFTWENMSINSIIWHFYLAKPITISKVNMFFRAHSTP